MIKKISFGVFLILFLILLGTYVSYSDFENDALTALQANSQVAETSAGPIEYQINGDSGPVVLFLHGTPGGYDQGLQLDGYRVLTPSRPGYLRTPIKVGRTPAEQAEAYAALLDFLGIDSVVVMGISGGGPSAIAFAAAYPDNTSALIAMEAVSQRFGQAINGENDAAQLPFFLQSDFVLWMTLSLTEWVLGAEGILDLVITHPPNRELVLSDPEKMERIAGLIWSVWPISQRNDGQQNDALHFASLDLPSGSVTVPTLIVHGTKDVNVPFAQSEALAQQIPHAVLHTVEGADHMMPFSHAEEVDDTLARFLAGLPLRD